MPTQNIECQLAQGQLNRYLAGDPISETALVQLEGHVSECDTCRMMLSEKRKALEAMVSPPAHTTVATKASDVESETPLEASSPVPKFLVDAIRRGVPGRAKGAAPSVNLTHAVIEDTREDLPTRSAFLKPLIFSLGLAGVLILMSTIMRDPTRFLGDRVSGSDKQDIAPTKAADLGPGTLAASATADKTQQPESNAAKTQDNQVIPKTDTDPAPPVVEGSATPVRESKVTPEEPKVDANAAKVDAQEPAKPLTPQKPSTGSQSPNQSRTQSVRSTQNASKRRSLTATEKRTRPKRRSSPTRLTKPVKTQPEQPKLRVYDESGNVVAAP